MKPSDSKPIGPPLQEIRDPGGNLPHWMILVGALAFALLLLSSCAAFEPKVEYVPYQVKVPIAVPCAAPVPAEPEWATKNMPHVDPATGEGIDVAVDKLVIEREQRMGYEEKLKAATEGCGP